MKITNLIFDDFEWDAIVLLANSELAMRGQENALISEMTPQNILRLALAAAARMLVTPERPRLQASLHNILQSAPFQPRQRGGARLNTGNRHKANAASESARRSNNTRFDLPNPAFAPEHVEAIIDLIKQATRPKGKRNGKTERTT